MSGLAPGDAIIAASGVDEDAAKNLDIAVCLADNQDFARPCAAPGECGDVDLVGHEHQSPFGRADEVAGLAGLAVSRIA